jgi:hypothetical protein
MKTSELNTQKLETGVFKDSAIAMITFLALLLIIF